eukprot:gene2448-biopygen6934
MARPMRRPRGSGCRTCHIRKVGQAPLKPHAASTWKWMLKVDAILLSQPGDGRQIVNGSRLRRARHADQGDDSCLLGAALNNLRLHLIDAHSGRWGVMRGSTASAMCSELSDVVTEVVTEDVRRFLHRVVEQLGADEERVVVAVVPAILGSGSASSQHPRSRARQSPGSSKTAFLIWKVAQPRRSRPLSGYTQYNPSANLIQS